MRDVNPKNLARLENNNMNNKSALLQRLENNNMDNKSDPENHHMDWNKSKILEKETDYIKRRFLESFFIHSNNYAF